MVSAARFVGVLAGGCLLGLGVSNCQFNAGPARDTSWPADAMKIDPSDRSPITESIKGEVLRVEGTNYVVKREGGEEVSLHTDSTTQKIGEISEGYNIEAEVNPQHHAVSIRATTIDRPNAKSESMLAQ